MENISHIEITGAKENNLRGVDLKIPRNRLTVITGVSGSGKSSIVYDTLYRESQRLYFSSFPAWKRTAQRFSRPDVKSIRGLNAAIAIDQNTSVTSARSTVGTFSGIYDLLRLLFSRFGSFSDDLYDHPEFFNSSGTLTRSLFSFNSPLGQCSKCRGYGEEDFIDPELIVDDWKKSIRDRALKITAPNGYIIYSQVTLDVLDSVCREHGFSVDTPLCDLNKEQLNALFYGSEKIKVPFGKHTLESRMKWTGIKAKPREEGYYRGFINVMLEILKRDRNKNILRFVRSRKCSACNGTRLSDEALQVKFSGLNIAELSDYDLNEFLNFFRQINIPEQIDELKNEIIETAETLVETGLGHLKLSRPSSTLSSGEIQRIKIAALLRSSLTGVTFILDEPTVGLHRSEARRIIGLLKQLRDKGNTVIIVEHDIDTILAADHIIETGPVGGIDGGQILFSGTLKDFLNLEDHFTSPTLQSIRKEKKIPETEPSADSFILENTSLKFLFSSINIITGPGGSGKRTLLKNIVDLGSQKNCITVNRSPIGKTPRSNPATYTGISDNIRDIFAKLDGAEEAGLTKSSFSFNTKGGRCEVCEGAGVIETGMKHFGVVRTTCEKCRGKRFNDDVLKIRYRDLSISDIYDLSVNQAAIFFSDRPKILRTLKIMIDLGVGYLKLGQPSSTLSGGEAQRVRLASYLRKNTKETIFLFEEPTTGLHPKDVENLISTLRALVNSGNTVIAIEHDPDFILAGDHVTELSGKPADNFENTVFQGTVRELSTSGTLTGKVVADYISEHHEPAPPVKMPVSKTIELSQVTTNNLKNIDVSIAKGKFTVVTGVSGSGKSSLVFDTLFSKSINCFLQGFSPYFRSLFKTPASSVIKSSGLMAPIGVSEKFIVSGTRSTVGTASGIWEILRMLFSRVGKINGKNCGYSAGDFSFNSASGACPVCEGRGTTPVADIEKIITDREKSFSDGALLGTTPGRYFGDSDGQFIHTLETVGRELGLDLSRPVNELDEKALEIALNGAGGRQFHVAWKFSRGNRSGTHEFTGKWPGFIHLFTEEYLKSIGNKNEAKLYSLMKEVKCGSCDGNRLKNELLDVDVKDRKVKDIVKMTLRELAVFIGSDPFSDDRDKAVSGLLFSHLKPMLKTLDNLGLSHLNISRPVSELSLGERERLKLVKLSVSALTDILYIVDEPSRGIHPADSRKITELIKQLTSKGNTVVAVEHEPSVIKEADRIIDIGPGAGMNGGRIIFDGTFSELLNSDCPTSEAFRSEKIPKEEEDLKKISFSHPGIYDLKKVSCNITLGGLNVITGVSGSGKTTLLREVLHRQLKGNVIFHENTAFSGGSGSTVATCTKLKDAVKRMISKSSGIKTWKDSQCKNCKGTGYLTIPMDHLSDPVVQCPDCEGTGFRKSILDAKYNDRNIVEILSMSVKDAQLFLAGNRKITEMLKTLSSCGLGYLTLDQTVRSLSNGEKQRLTLATDLAEVEPENTFFLFDEPSTGLHFSDIKGFLALFKDLTNKGGTVICAEHRMQIISQADHIIDMGPESGINGGSIVFEGSVKKLIDCGTKTGAALKEYLNPEK